jgi:hypothetical protein
VIEQDQNGPAPQKPSSAVRAEPGFQPRPEREGQGRDLDGVVLRLMTAKRKPGGSF